MKEEKVSAGLKEESQWNGVPLSLTETPAKGPSTGQVNWAYQHDPTMSDSDSDTGCHGDEEKGMACRSGTHSIILDISTTSFVDTVTVKTLQNVCVCQHLSALTLFI